MKVNYRSLFFSVLAAGVLASCNNGNETVYGNESPVVEGLPAFARISLNVNGHGVSRSASQTGEKEFESVKILVFSKSGVLETVADVAKNEIDGGNSVSVNTTTGEKNIYAIANPTEELSGKIKQGMSIDEFKALKFTAVTQEEEPVYKNTVEVAKANNFVMSGSTSATIKSSEEANNIKVEVTRFATKAQLMLPESAKTSNENFKPEGVKVTFSNAKFQLVQMNKGTLMEVKKGGFGANGADSEQTKDDVNKTFKHLTIWNNALNTEESWTTAFTSGDFATTGTAAYASENINETPRVGNVTFAMIQVKLTPKQWSSNDGTISGDGTFYAVVEYNSGSEKIFENIKAYHGIYKDETTAKTEMNKLTDVKANCAVVKYDKGLCYYRLNLRDITKTNVFERYSVIRNHFYQMKVTEILNPGANNPGDLIPTEPETPVEENADIKVNITVAEWTDVEMNEPLG